MLAARGAGGAGGAGPWGGGRQPAKKKQMATGPRSQRPKKKNTKKTEAIQCVKLMQKAEACAQAACEKANESRTLRHKAKHESEAAEKLMRQSRSANHASEEALYASDRHLQENQAWAREARYAMLNFMRDHGGCDLETILQEARSSQSSSDSADEGP